MSTILKQLTDNDNNDVMPFTKTKAVFDEQGNRLDNLLSNINVYVGEDKKLHFVDASGADSALPFSKCEKGEFTSAPNTDGLVEINLGFRPTRVECWFSFNDVSKETLGNQMCAYYDATLSTTQSIWNLHPAEGTIYYLDLNASSGETGISHITDTGFKFRAHGGNTTNTKVRYIAY